MLERLEKFEIVEASDGRTAVTLCDELRPTS